MSISSPLPSTAFSTRPLDLAFSLEGLFDHPTTSLSKSTFSTSTEDEGGDVFDELDRERGRWGMDRDSDSEQDDQGNKREADGEVVKEEKESANGRQSTTSSYPYALSDRTSRLYPSANLEVETDMASRAPVEGDDVSTGNLPEWLRETSARVNRIVAGKVFKEERRLDEGGTVKKVRKPRRRVAVGCEDGSVWIFGTMDVATVNGAGDADVDRHVSLGDERKHSPLSSRPPTSPPLSPTTTQTNAVPRIVTRKSSASISTLSSFTSQSNRNPSGPPSITGSTSTYSEIKNDSRLRKASATISVSTTSAIPATNNHSHPHDSRHHPSKSITSDSDEPTLPPLSPPSHSPTFPLSPIPSHPPNSSSIPHFRFSPSTQSSRAPSPRRNPQGLASKKEMRSGSISSTRHATTAGGTIVGSKRSHSRAKESLSNGIGLWQGSNTTASMTDLLSNHVTKMDLNAESLKNGLGISGARGDADERSDEIDEKWGNLEPLFQILSSGSGEVVGLSLVSSEELPYVGDGSEGDVLVILRRSGHLSIVSLVDGTCLGRCDAGSAEKGEFRDLKIVKSGSLSLAVCTARGDTSFSVLANLENLEVIEILDGVRNIDVSGGHSPSILYSVEDSNALFQRAIIPLPPPTSTLKGLPRVVGERRSLGPIEGWSRPLGLRRSGEIVIVWDATGLSVAAIENGHLVPIALLPLDRILDVRFCDGNETFVVAARDSISLYEIVQRGNHREVKLSSERIARGLETLTFLPSSPSDPTTSLLVAEPGGNGTRSLNLLRIIAEKEELSDLVVLYQSQSVHRGEQVTCCHKVDAELVLVGTSTGSISSVLIASLGDDQQSLPVDVQLDGSVTLLDVIDVGGREVVVAGTSTGIAGAWTLSDWEPLGVFALFASPILSYAYLSLPSSPRTLLFVSCNSPIALISLDPPKLLFTLPGTRTPVHRVAMTKEGEVMVLYKQGLARFWDAETGELRRSTDRKTAEGVLNEKEKGWKIWFDVDTLTSTCAATSQVYPSVIFDLRSALEEIARELPWMSSRRTPRKGMNGFDSLDATPDISRAASPALFNGRSSSPELDQLDIAKRWLSVLVPFGVDTGSDETLEQLGVEIPSIPLIAASTGLESLSFAHHPNPRTPWTTSPRSTAQRLLQIVCLLRVFLNYPSTERTASEAILYFASCLEDSVGREFEKPSLEYLANYWLDKNLEVQQAARSLFGTYVASLSDDEIVSLVELWQDQLPVRQSYRAITHFKADIALLIIGLVAVDRFKLLSAHVLKDLSTSISVYLDDVEHPFHQAIATELCSRGFHIWQNYVDAMSLVRQLFAIAIGRNPSTPSDLRALARQATVHVAGVNSPLFMSTLLYDILNAPTAVTRNATLKLLGFMIRKKPLVLHHSLPRVAEAVVKSLDPTISDLRETVHQTATVILNELVRTFPSIDFHGKSQRLAVGTHEGSSIVYDLKTATRLYVLEGHRRPVTAVSWSTDGHRLVTVSLEESKVCVWKTGMGLLSMIGAPVQRAGSPPFKEWDFHVGDEAHMTIAATLEWVVVDWPADRTVRLRIRETALSFGA